MFTISIIYLSSAIRKRKTIDKTSVSDLQMLISGINDFTYILILATRKRRAINKTSILDLQILISGSKSDDYNLLQ